MTREMSLGQFVEFLDKMAASMPEKERAGLRDGAAIIRQEARDEIGTYQRAGFGFPGWPKLAETTLHGWRGYPGKIALG